jgi:hypothetical protein
VAPYFKVIYTNGADSQGVFYLTTMFHKGQSSAIDNNGFLKVMTTPGFVISSSDFTSGSYSLATLSDTLSGESDTVTFNFGNQYKTCAVVIRDTTGGSALVDSIKIETYNSTLQVWTTKATGFYDAGTGDILYGDCIVPGNGVTKKYYLNCLYPSQVRITWHKSVADALNPSFPKAGRIVPIAFEGSN